MRRVAVLGLILAVAGSLAGSASPTHGKNVWSGQWTTSTGALGLRWISDADGTKAIETFGGRPCPEPTDYFRGGYTTGAGDHGGVVGCTVNWRRLIARWNTNLASARDGTFDVSYSGGHQPGDLLGSLPGGRRRLRPVHREVQGPLRRRRCPEGRTVGRRRREDVHLLVSHLCEQRQGREAPRRGVAAGSGACDRVGQVRGARRPVSGQSGGRCGSCPTRSSAGTRRGR